MIQWGINEIFMKIEDSRPMLVKFVEGEVQRFTINVEIVNVDCR